MYLVLEVDYMTYGGKPAYRISKAALNELTGSLQQNLHILVNFIHPEWVATERNKRNSLGRNTTI
jgi:NAD(P)-dependent dehydrogenase (short-subunit alcohol dehydrogenase family)